MLHRDRLMDAAETVSFVMLALFTAFLLLKAEPGAAPHTHDGVHWHAHPGVR